MTLTHVLVGLFKGTVYAVLVALAGCLQGMSAGRSAQAVGDATTASVVQAIVWIVVAASDAHRGVSTSEYSRDLVKEWRCRKSVNEPTVAKRPQPDVRRRRSCASRT